LLLEDARFYKALGNTFLFAVMTVPVGTVSSLLLAVLINQPLRAMVAFRTTYYLPVVTSFVAVSFIWLWLYEPQFGIFNQVLAAVGLPPLAWLRDPNTALLSIAILSIWKTTQHGHLPAGLQHSQYSTRRPRSTAPAFSASAISPANAHRRPSFSSSTIGALQMFVQPGFSPRAARSTRR
jgi:hypothetical protein